MSEEQRLSFLYHHVDALATDGSRRFERTRHVATSSGAFASGLAALLLFNSRLETPFDLTRIDELVVLSLASCLVALIAVGISSWPEPVRRFEPAALKEFMFDPSLDDEHEQREIILALHDDYDEMYNSSRWREIGVSAGSIFLVAAYACIGVAAIVLACDA